MDTILTITRLYTILAVCGLSLIFATDGFASHYQKINKSTLKSTDQKTLLAQINLGDNYQLKPTTLTSLPNGLKKQKFDIFFRGVPLWNSQVNVTVDNNGQFTSAYGYYVKGLERSLTSLKPRIKKDDALAIGLKSADIRSKNKVSLKQSTLYIRQNTLHQAKLVYLVSFLRDDDKPTRPFFFIDAMTGNILMQWEGINRQKIATGPGGNGKVGQYEYGTDYDFMDVDVRGNACWMITDKVDTMNHIVDNTFGFNCPRNTFTPRNGAYSPINDAHFFASLVADMYQAWYAITPLNGRIRQLVYAFEGANATWNGSYVSFGNGNSAYYPMTTLDITSHEIAHGFTQRYSGLIYRNQSGGMNESFSDVAGEAAKYFFKGSTDWFVGADAAKTGWGLRSFIEPTRDGKQIAHIRDYRAGMNVHTSSGPFNHAFYLLSQMKDWSIKKAFDVFVLANQQYWTRESSFNQGADGLAKAALDLNYPAADVCSALRVVGAKCDYYPAPGHEPIEIVNGETYHNIDSDIDQQRLFKITVPENVSNFRITTRGGEGDADLYVRKDSLPTLDDYDCRPNLSGNDETCFYQVPLAGIYYIMLDASLAYKNLTLEASFIDKGCRKTIDLHHLSGKKDSQVFYAYCPEVKGNKILISDGQGDADLYVKKGAKPSLNDYDCRPFKRGNEESCTLGEPGQYMIMIHGYKDYSGLRLHSHGNY